MKFVCPYTPPCLFDGIDEVAADKVACQYLGGERADDEGHFMNMLRDEIGRDVANVAMWAPSTRAHSAGARRAGRALERGLCTR